MFDDFLEITSYSADKNDLLYGLVNSLIDRALLAF